EEEEE
ncbi:dna polymerase zeta, partial [Nannochloropsis oceanica]